MRRDTYRPPGKKGPLPNDNSTTESVIPRNQLIIETFYHTFVHISEIIKEDFSVNKMAGVGGSSEGIKQLTEAKDEKEEKKKKSQDNDQKIETMKKAAEHEIHSDKHRIEPVCGNYSRDDNSKMIFVLE